MNTLKILNIKEILDVNRKEIFKENLLYKA